jgi:hypothetical protein
MRSNTIKTLLLAMTTSILAACGGGESASSGTTTSTPTPIVNRVATLSISSEVGEMNELSQINIPVTVDYTGSENLTFTATNISDIDGVTASVVNENGTYYLNVVSDDILTKNITHVLLTIEATDGSVSDQDTIEVIITNTSHNKLFSDNLYNLNNVESLELSYELNNLSAFASDKAYLLGLISHKERIDWLNATITEIEVIEKQIIEEIREGLNELSFFELTITEAEALDKLNAIAEKTYESGKQFSTITDKINALNVPNFTVPTTISLSTFEAQGITIYSLFYGNSTVGALVDDAWVFKDEWLLLEKLIPLNDELCINPIDA